MQATSDDTPAGAPRVTAPSPVAPQAPSPSSGLRGRFAELFPAGSLRARFARGAFWSLIGAAVSQGLGMFAEVVVARRLGKTTFGELGMIESTVGLFGVF